MLPPPLDPGPIIRAYRGASTEALRTGRAWYRETAARILGYVVGASGGRLTREQSAAVVSLLSPRKAWRDNVRQALDVAERVADGRDAGGGRGIFSRVRPLLRSVCSGDVTPGSVFGPGAPKTRAFYANLRGDLDPVTVDVWAARAVGVAPEALGRPGVYDAVADAYRAAACALGDAPASVQAVAWIAARGAPGSLVFGPSLPLTGRGPTVLF